MRKLFAITLLALPLAACQTPNPGTFSPVVTTAVGLLPQQVQDVAVKTCSFLPAAETVASLIAAFGGPSVPGVVNQIAAEICGAVTRPKAAGRRSAARPPAVRGVAIRGQFVR